MSAPSNTLPMSAPKAGPPVRLTVRPSGRSSRRVARRSSTAWPSSASARSAGSGTTTRAVEPSSETCGAVGSSAPGEPPGAPPVAPPVEPPSSWARARRSPATASARPAAACAAARSSSVSPPSRTNTAIAGETPEDGSDSRAAAARADSASSGSAAAVVETGSGSPANASTPPDASTASRTTTHFARCPASGPRTRAGQPVVRGATAGRVEVTSWSVTGTLPTTNSSTVETIRSPRRVCKPGTSGSGR